MTEPDLNCPEYTFYKKFIENDATVIFDVGSRFDSVFHDFNGDVHYFEPNKEYLDKLKVIVNNKNSFFNNFGLSDTNDNLTYYNEQMSFVQRKLTHPDTYQNWSESTLEVKKADEYIKNNNIQKIDFVKIDTEGFEFNVIKGFGEEIRNVKYLQFEYGGTYIDTGVKLKEVIEYLKERGFVNFTYLIFKDIMLPVGDNLDDHYQHTNIVCINKKFIV